MIVDLCPYWTNPPSGGGPLRIFNLNKYISETIPIKQFSFRPTYIMKKLGEDILRSSTVTINESYTEYRESNPLMLLSSFILYKSSIPSDFLFSRFVGLFKNKTLDHLLTNADIVQVEHPWLFDFATKKAKDSLIVSSSHNCEFFLMRDSINKFMKNPIREMEKRSIENADIVLVVSKEDINKFHEILDVKRKKNIFIIPNGVDCSKITLTSLKERQMAKKRLGLDGKKIILFTGSIHAPNLEAIRIIQEEIGKDAKDKNTIFLVVGSVGEGLTSYKNIIFTGFVKDVSIYLQAADLAICPLLFGSGTSLKMLEYMAYGLPVISTTIGARGLDAIHKKHVIISEISDFTYWISEVLANQELYSNISINGRKFVEERYDWKNIASKSVNIYKQFLNM